MKNSNVKFNGVMSALVSCIDEHENINEDAMRRLMAWHLKEGFTGFYLTGGTGEGPVLQKETRKRIAEIAKDAVGDQAKLIAHVGAIDLKTASELARHAGKIGLDAISSVPPFFFHYGEQEIADYYKALADASGLPVLMYASPLSGVNITWDMVDRLMDIPNMIGLKWTSYDYFTMHRIKSLRGGNINVINGPDECLLCGLVMGADGGIGATYNVMPKLFAEIYRHFHAGDIPAAQAAQFKANKMIELLIRFGVVCAIKEILSMIGYDCGHQVFPQKRMKDEEKAALRKALQEIRFEEEYL
ncbi:MAG: dihydrodipicolinate synthase family protein [Christensenellales bacterium]|jgi:N-acetylneuraminate lyase